MFELARRIMNNVISLVEHVKCDLVCCNNNVRVKVTPREKPPHQRRGGCQSSEGPFNYIIYYYMATKEDIIKSIYHHPENGFGSIQDTLTEARKQDPTITYKDVAQWKERT